MRVQPQIRRPVYEAAHCDVAENRPQACNADKEPVKRTSAVNPEAMPARCGGTAPCITFVVSLLRSPAPAPATSIQMRKAS
jgi:hypothetical protein